MLSEVDREFLKKELGIISREVDAWNFDELERLVSLLKFSEPIEREFCSFYTEKNPRNISEYMERFEANLTEFNYFPFHKLKCAITILTGFYDDDSMQQSVLNRNILEVNDEIDIPQFAVLALVDGINKLHETEIVLLTSTQIWGLMRSCGLQEHAEIAKKYNIDGFTAVCSLSDSDIVRDIRNYFENYQVKKILELSYIFLIQYYRLIALKTKKRVTICLDKKETTETEEEIQRNEVKEWIIESHEPVKKNSEDEIEIDPLAEEMGESEYGQSEMGESDYAVSERGSVYAESEYASSVRGSVDFRLSYKVGNNNNLAGRASLMYDSEIICELRDSCISVPFDLLNLEPLHTIKIKALKTPFGKEIEREVNTFKVQGAKMGRDKENDLRFPDELSISSKHAQIIFKAENFYLQDLGSKTGTYLRILKSIKIEDETCIQFSTEVEILFKIIKKTESEGIIKAETKKPENMPDYRISLKDGYKIKIGKNERCHIRINHSSIAERHSEIYFKDSNFYFKNCHNSSMSWLRLSPKSVKSEAFKLEVGDIFRLSSKKSYIVESITNELLKFQTEALDR